MNFYKCSDNFIINLDLVKTISRKDNDWHVYFIGEQDGVYIMSCMAAEIKRIIFSKRKEKEFREVKAICSCCGEIFKANMLFDENNVSVSVVPKLCVKCFVKVGNEKG